MALFYQWTEDGEAELCTREDIDIIAPIEWCYHCGSPIGIGKASKITTQTDTYIMHTYCADKGCWKKKDYKSGAAAPLFLGFGAKHQQAETRKAAGGRFAVSSEDGDIFLCLLFFALLPEAPGRAHDIACNV